MLTVASTRGPHQYFVTRQLGKLRVQEVRGAILEQLRSRPLHEFGTLRDGDEISALMNTWKELTSEALPDDVLKRLRAQDAPPLVKMVLKELGWS